MLLLLFVFFLGIASYIAFIFADIRYAYYLPFTRAFELFTGSILAIKYSNINKIHSKIITNILSILALIGILYPSIFIKEENFPTWAFIIPCISAAIIILLGKSHTLPMGNRVLSFRPLVLIGLISYALYLWHWPIIAYINYLGIIIDW